MREKKWTLPITLLMLSALCVNLFLTCAPRYREPMSNRARELFSVFQEKFGRVIKNADRPIGVTLELSHKDGNYLEGDTPYVYMETNRQAHVRLLYVTSNGEVLQKFPPPIFNDSYELEGFVSDLYEKNVRHRVPERGGRFRYVATLPEGFEEVEEVAIAIASSYPFTTIDSLLYEKRVRIESGPTRSGTSDTALNLGMLLYPESILLQWAPMVFDLFRNIFLRRKSGYQFGYAYKVVTIKRE